ncbi:hypothetical protein GOV12_00150 [Candidatus Pacearchaeota archaeon]|nr:hypothetical protein [Candidatus Pacearchaeota archaeon]
MGEIMGNWIQYRVDINEKGFVPIYINAPLHIIKIIMDRFSDLKDSKGKVTQIRKDYEFSFNRGLDGSLEIKAKNWGYALKAAHKIGLPFNEELIF